MKIILQFIYRKKKPYSGMQGHRQPNYEASINSGKKSRSLKPTAQYVVLLYVQRNSLI
jgi:hypothetical protein